MTVSSIKRRILEYGRSKRSGKRVKPTENIVTSSLLGNYGKYFLLGGVIILLDFLVDFRVEFFYTAGLLFRSCIDSYKYQGVLFTLLFVALVVYVDIFCLSLLNAVWLHFLASVYIWLQMLWQNDHGLSVGMLLTWFPFLYFEMTFRFNHVPQYLLNISRPFAAHCIGYPMVTLGFACKTYITCMIQQHHQKKVQEVNTFYNELVTKALPQSTIIENTEEPRELTKPLESTAKSDSPKAKEESDMVTATVKPSKSKGTGNGTKNIKTSSTINLNKNKPIASNNVNKAQQTESPTTTAAAVAAQPANVTNKTRNSSSSVSSIQEVVPSHVVLTVEAVQPITTHVSGKKQAAVKAVPRAKLEGEELVKEQHVKSMNDALLADLEKERLIRRENEALVYNLQMEVKQLKADLQASQLQEEESVSQKGQLASLEKNHRYDLQRLKAQNETLTNKLLTLSTSQTEDKAAIIDLERRLKKEMDARSRVDAELREHRHAITNAFTQEELAGLRKKVQEQQQELGKLREQLKEQQHGWEQRHKREMEVLTASIHSLTEEKGKLMQESKQLTESLADETKIKINLFSFVSETRRKQEATEEQLAWKNKEIAQLKHQITQLLAMVPHPTNTKTPPPP